MPALLAAAALARLAGGMVPFGAVALFSQRHDFGAAGAALAASLIATSLTAPQRGRLVDRFSPRTVLPLMALGFAAAVCLAALAAGGHAPIALPVTLLALASALAPPTTAVLRTIWSVIATDDREASAFHALDSVLEEITFTVSPLLVRFFRIDAGGESLRDELRPQHPLLGFR